MFQFLWANENKGPDINNKQNCCGIYYGKKIQECNHSYKKNHVKENK